MTRQEIIEKLSDKKASLIEVYLDLQQYFETKYGTDTVVVMEVGSFFEVYGVNNDDEKIGKPKEIAQLLNLQLTRKNKTIAHNDAKNPLLAGFPTASFDRYMARMVQENKYTIVLIRQKGNPPNVTRYIDTILSPGVHFDFSTPNGDAYLTSLVVDQNKGMYHVGLSHVDVSTGITRMQQLHSTTDDTTYALDATFKLLQTFPSCETLIKLLNESIDLDFLLQYLELGSSKLQILNETHSTDYQNELFTRAFAIESFMTGIEFLGLEKRPILSASLSQLIEFVIQHDESLAQKLQSPKEIGYEGFLYLGNNPLTQLDIVQSTPAGASLLDLLNNTITPLGKRLLRERLTCPITDIATLQDRYALIETVSDHASELSRSLSSVYDLERILRRIQLGRLHPFEVNFLYDSLLSCKHVLLMLVQTNTPLIALFDSYALDLDECLEGIDRTFDLEATTKTHFHGISTSLFQSGFDNKLDELLEQQRQLENDLEVVRSKFLQLLETQTGRYEASFVQVKQLDKEGHHLSITKSRFSLIEDALEDEFVSLAGTAYALADFDYKHQKTNVKISAKFLEDLSQEIVSVQVQIIGMTKELFAKQIAIIDENYGHLIAHCAHFLAQVDVAVAGAINAKTLRLVKPTLVESEESFFQAKDLRHPLVEAREENGIYVPNSLALGKEAPYAPLFPDQTKGIILYGINSSGKSSLMKSMGIAVIMAQAGMFVSATELTLSPYHGLFTRIQSHDDFQKGLSSFAVEMMEMKNIFNRANPKSLILGDEISRGTETLSSLAIVTAAIERLNEIQAHFVLTTHLHQLSNMDLLANTSNIACLHLSVNYDEANDTLVFNRKLQEGSGSSIYGLEFAHSLHIDEKFLQKAKSIRKKLAGEMSDLELLVGKKTSLYNKKVFVTKCSVCNNNCEEIHHIEPQKKADTDGNLGHFHKDHKYNLIALCSNCHDDVHAGKITIHGYIMTSKGPQLSYETNK